MNLFTVREGWLWGSRFALYEENFGGRSPDTMLQALKEVFDKPIIPYEPGKHSLKAWATFCLRNRGFKVVYAEKTDFAIESKTQGKVYFNVALAAPETPEPGVWWIIWNDATQTATIIPAN